MLPFYRAGGDENKCDSVLIGSGFHFLPCLMGGGSGLEGFVIFFKSNELGSFGLGWQSNHFCFIMFSVMLSGG